jgi:drug/metabolite transporter (DMT)-like permease
LALVKITSRVATVGIITVSIMMGTVPIFARALTDGGMAPVAVVFYRNIVGFVILGAFLRVTREKRRAFAWGLVMGVAMGLGWTSYVEALEVVPVATAAVLYMSYPIFAILFAWVLFRDTPHPRALGGALAVIAAAGLALGPELDGDHKNKLLIMIVAPVSFGFAVAVVTNRLGSLKVSERVVAISIGSMVGLGPLMLSLPSDETKAWFLVAGIGVITGAVPQLIYSLVAPAVGAARAALAGTIELPTMFVVGWLVFEEPFTMARVVAGVLVVGVIAIVPSRPSPATAAVRRRRRLVPGRFH